jgi:pimeloyl-ACP methyl ester carboxylesterase
VPEPRARRMAGRGLTLQVWELGRGGPGGPPVPVVCLHGWLDQGLAWAAALGALPGTWLCPDQRGFGGSDRVGPGGYYHFLDHVADLDALVDALGGSVDLVGHSMGGTVAACFAGARPERVRRLVLVEGMGPPGPEEDSQLRRLRLHLRGRGAPPAPRSLPSLAAAAAQLQDRHPGLGAEHAALLARHGTRPDGAGGLQWAADPLHRVPGCYPFREAWFAEFLGAIAAPTLVVWAEDSWYDPATRARRAGWIGGPTRTAALPGGHLLPYDQPAALGALCAAHLGDPGEGPAGVPAPGPTGRARRPRPRSDP